MLHRLTGPDLLARLDEFDAVIDARSESEYALDRLPGAVNWPSLTDPERVLVGTEYVQGSTFVARKRGAAMVARNIAVHLERHVLDKPKGWRPLVYCWRGGSRSGVLASMLDQIGFQVHQLEGGYKAYRHAVMTALDELPARYRYRVVCGVTGSGKSRLLQRLQARGAQVLDLEALANHRGSVLGLVPGEAQPSQKQFDSRIWTALRSFDPTRPVFIESESKKVGDLRVPALLIERMRASECVRLHLGFNERVTLLMEDYAHFVDDPATFCGRLNALRAMRGHAVINGWQEAAMSGRIADVFSDLLVEHYDPIYEQSMARNFTGATTPTLEMTWDGSPASLEAVAAELSVST